MSRANSLLIFLTTVLCLILLAASPGDLNAQEAAPHAPESAAEELAQSVEPAEQPAQNTTASDAPRVIPDAPTPSAGEAMPIEVEHHGTDNVGARLALHLKELFNRSSLFRVSSKNERKIKLMLHTKVEFSGRPNSSSIYSAVWLYSENEGTLKYYLASETGIVDSAALEYTAELLVARSDTESGKYAYLFE